MTRKLALLLLGAALAAAASDAHAHRWVVTTNAPWREDVYAPASGPAAPRDTNNFCGPHYVATAEGCRPQTPKGK